MEWLYDSMCFACGEQNPIGLKLKFDVPAEGIVVTSFTPNPNHQSWPGIMHGGLTATVVDELMGRCVNALGYAGVTVRFELRYRSAIPVGETINFEAKVVKQRLPIMDLEAKGVTSSGKVVVEATGRFMIKGSYEEFINQLQEGATLIHE